MTAAKREPAAKTAAKTGPKTGAKRATSGRSGRSTVPKRARSRWRPTAGGRLREQLDPKRGPVGIEALIDAAARCADRLEVLDRLHHGDGDAWLRPELVRLIAEATPARERKAFYVDVALRIDNTIAEERQQTKLLASLLSDIYRQRANLPPAPPPSANGQEGDDLDDLDDD